MGLNLSNRQIAAEPAIILKYGNENSIQEMTAVLRNGIVAQEPQVRPAGTVECDKVYIVAGQLAAPIPR